MLKQTTTKILNANLGKNCLKKKHNLRKKSSIFLTLAKTRKQFFYNITLTGLLNTYILLQLTGQLMKTISNALQSTKWNAVNKEGNQRLLERKEKRKFYFLALNISSNSLKIYAFFFPIWILCKAFSYIVSTFLLFPSACPHTRHFLNFFITLVPCCPGVCSKPTRSFHQFSIWSRVAVFI